MFRIQPIVVRIGRYSYTILQNNYIGTARRRPPTLFYMDSIYHFTIKTGCTAKSRGEYSGIPSVSQYAVNEILCQLLSYDRA